jgi:hypothetical protein
VNSQVNLPTPAFMVVTALDDPVTDSLGHRPGSSYVEDVWLGVLGPTTTWAWLRLARVAEQSPGSTLDMADLARSLGLGTGTGPNAPMSRTLGRLVVFGAVERSGDTLLVRRALPDVPNWLLASQAASARLAHERLGHTHVASREAVRTAPAASGSAVACPEGPGAVL